MGIVNRDKDTKQNPNNNNKKAKCYRKVTSCELLVVGERNFGGFSNKDDSFSRMLR